MNGSLVYSNTAISSTDSTVSIGHHTQSIHVCNLHGTDDAVIELNGRYSILIPHRHSNSHGTYVVIPGDYTSIKVVTASVSVSVFAVG